MKRSLGLACAATLVLGASLIATGSSRAAECSLEQAASLDIVAATDGTLLIPITIENTPRYLTLSFDNSFTYIGGDVAAELKVPIGTIPKAISIFAEGQPITRRVLASFQLGLINGKNLEFLVLPQLHRHDPRQSGIIGLSLLAAYDVELDLAGNKLNLFSQKHCPGQVVYWPNSGVTTTPLVRQPAGQMLVTIELDGHRLQSAFDTTAARSYVPFSKATTLYGLKVDSPGMVATPRSEAEENFRTMDHYRYPFKSLSANGVTILNPEVYIVDDRGERCDGKFRTAGGNRPPQACYGGQDFILGLKSLRAMHIFIAFSEKKIYYTAAAAQPPSAATPPAP